MFKTTLYPGNTYKDCLQFTIIVILFISITRACHYAKISKFLNNNYKTRNEMCDKIMFGNIIIWLYYTCSFRMFVRNVKQILVFSVIYYNLLLVLVMKLCLPILIPHRYANLFQLSQIHITFCYCLFFRDVMEAAACGRPFGHVSLRELTHAQRTFINCVIVKLSIMYLHIEKLIVFFVSQSLGCSLTRTYKMFFI